MIMHVLKHEGLPFDYLVGAKLPGFEQSVDITDAHVIICEGDEYPASVVEKRPKFHFLFPHMAIITGIAWDHINVFPTFENYLEQFHIFIDKIEPGGTLIFNQRDEILSNLVEAHPRTDITKIGYDVPDHYQNGQQTILTMGALQVPLRVFGDHNLLNLHAAWLVCKHLGVSMETFMQAIGSFTGAAKRLERLAESAGRVVFRDFAHAPSKVAATMEAVKNQFPHKKVAAVLELHTYSSLNENFMPHYQGALQAADAACVFYSPHAMEIKRMPPLPASSIIKGFGKQGLVVLTDRTMLEDWLKNQQMTHDNLLLMSSGTFDGMDVQSIANDWVY